jgi:hypothetical protein
VKSLLDTLPLADAQKEKIITTLRQEEAAILESIPAPNEGIQVVRKASIDF